MGLIHRERRDIFYKIAKALGYRSRSALKLLQIHESTNILEGVIRAVDLCASPGGFSKLLTEYVPKPVPNAAPNVLGIDVQLIVPFDGAEFWIRDITEKTLYLDILNHFGGSKVDIVVADGAPDGLGTTHEDTYYQMDLVLNSLVLGISILVKGGKFVSKVFRGKEVRHLAFIMSQFFDSILIAKPRVCRQSSCEAFIVCKGFKLPEQLSNVDTADLYDDFWPYVESFEVVPDNFTFDFIRCGSLQYDADANYPTLDKEFEEKFNINDKKHLEVLQLPTTPSYKAACELKRTNNLAKVELIDNNIL